MRAGLEIYKSDCNGYPVVDITTQTSLAGSGQLLNCPVTNVYISQIPTDPQLPKTKYLYSGTAITYEICTSLEQGGTAVTCGGSSNCGATPCNYKLTNP
jgi:hypothetical protein